MNDVEKLLESLELVNKLTLTSLTPSLFTALPSTISEAAYRYTRCGCRT